MNEQLEKLKAELLPLEQQRIKLDEMTRRRTNVLLWSGLGGKTLLLYLTSCKGIIILCSHVTAIWFLCPTHMG